MCQRINTSWHKHKITDNIKSSTLVWMETPQPCEIYGFCGDFGICNQQKVPHCDCSKGFEPVDPTDWDSYDYSGGCKRRNPLLQCQVEKSTSSSQCPTFAYHWHQHIQQSPLFPTRWHQQNRGFIFYFDVVFLYISCPKRVRLSFLLYGNDVSTKYRLLQ